MRDVIQATTAFMRAELGVEGTVISVDRVDRGWLAVAEATLVDEEMRRLAKRDLVATFELLLNDELHVQSFARKGMRERGSIPRNSGLAR